MKIVIAPDSFKGTMSAAEVAQIVKDQLSAEFPAAEFVLCPLADGGEGTVDSFHAALGGELKKVKVTGPNFKPVSARWLFVRRGAKEGGNLAVIETAEAAGLSLANPKDPSKTTTFGVGEQLRQALDMGAEEIILGLGGSATNDGGTGMAAALGTAFFDSKGKSFVPTGRSLKDIAYIEFTDILTEKYGKSTLTALCDVKNPFYGKNGAAYVYAPQKGADEKTVRKLDEGLRHLAEVLRAYGRDISRVEGAGAAGGLGGGVVAFLGGKLKSGIDAVLDISGFSDKARDADLIITGEGAFDSQSLSGKVIDGLRRRQGETPMVVVTGMMREKVDAPKILKVYETDPAHRPFEEVKGNAREDLKKAVLRLAADLKDGSLLP